MGAIVDESQRKTVEEFVEHAKSEGANVSTCIAINFILKLTEHILFDIDIQWSGVFASNGPR